MNGRAYYNENDAFAAQWLRNLIAAGLIAPGDVDDRSIKDVQPSDLAGYTQCHFFAGIGGWSYALRLAGWPDDRPVWTGSCPCQPFSIAGKREGFADARHLWPVWRELIRERSPATIFGEQVASAPEWLRLVRSDLEAMGCAVGAIPFEAASAGAYHLRDRYGFVAYRPREQVGASRQSRQHGNVSGVAMGDTCGARLSLRSIAEIERGDLRLQGSATAKTGVRGYIERSDRSGELSWVFGADGKARRIKSGIRLLVDGPATGLGRLRSVEDRIHEEISEYAASIGGDTGEVLRVLRESLSTEASVEWEARGPRRLSTSQVLLNLLLCLDAARDRASNGRCISQAITENHLRVVRGMRPGVEFVGSSCGRQPNEQRTHQYSDVVSALSQLLARHVEAHRTASRLAHAATNRTGMLRGFGNAIDPRAFSQFIIAAQEAIGDVT